MTLVPVTQLKECALRQRYITVFGAFALFDMNDHALAVNIGNFEAASLAEPETARIDDQQTNPVALKPDVFEDAANLPASENNRKSFFALRTNEVKGCPLFLERLSIEELDAAKRDGYGCTFPFFDVLYVQKVVPEFFFADVVRRFVEMLRQEPD
jgi:hypothetical protein